MMPAIRKVEIRNTPMRNGDLLSPRDPASSGNMTPKVLTLEGRDAQPLSVRAKALIFADPATQALLTHVEKIAPSDAPILILGETGTGKELLARHAHHLSG